MPGDSLGPGLAASAGILTLRRMGVDRHGEVGPMTVLGSGESAIEEGNRVKSGSTGERGGDPELGLKFGARSLTKRLRKSKDWKNIVEQSVKSMDNIGRRVDYWTSGRRACPVVIRGHRFVREVAKLCRSG